MTRRSAFTWISPSMLIISLVLTASCASKHSSARYSVASVGDACYAKALPSVGEGGLAWGSSLNMARQKSLANCIRYAGRSGGTPNTCQVVLAKCK